MMSLRWCYWLLVMVFYTPVLVAEVQLPKIAADFETVVITGNQQQTYQWHFWRGDNFVETENLNEHSGEAWTKSANGLISYQQISHSSQQILDYLPADLDAIGLTLNWRGIACLIDLQAFQVTGEQMLFKQKAIDYQQQSADGLLEMTWLSNDQIPAFIKRSQQNYTQTTRLTALYPLAESPWPYQRSRNYQVIDFADIGDKEDDEFIKTMAHKIKGIHRH